MFGCWRKQQPLLEEKWRRRSGKRKRKGGKGGKARVGRAAAVEEGMVGKRSIGVPTFSCVLLPGNLEILQVD